MVIYLRNRVFKNVRLPDSCHLFLVFFKIDVLIATSPQFFTAISGKFINIIKRKHWVLEIRDLWPDSIVAVNSITKNSIIYSVLKLIEKNLYQSANLIVVVTESFKNYLVDKHQINSKKIGVFKNGIIKNNLLFHKDKEVSQLRLKLGFKNKTVISYIGTHGLAHGLNFILDCIKYLDNSNYQFLFIGWR